MNTTTVAVDLAKSVFELAVSDGQGRVTERKRLSKEGFRAFFVNRARVRFKVMRGIEFEPDFCLPHP